LNGIAGWLTEQVAAKGWSFRELGRRAGISAPNIGSYARGDSVPKPSSCRKIADALGVSYREVMRLAGHLPPAPIGGPDIAPDEWEAMNIVRRARGKPPLNEDAIAGGDLSAEEAEMVDILRELPAHARAALWRQAAALAMLRGLRNGVGERGADTGSAQKETAGGQR
jgi:transcriptional regulator with XRE-family HTH domain